MGFQSQKSMDHGPAHGLRVTKIDGPWAGPWAFSRNFWAGTKMRTLCLKKCGLLVLKNADRVKKMRTVLKKMRTVFKLMQTVFKLMRTFLFKKCGPTV